MFRVDLKAGEKDMKRLILSHLLLILLATVMMPVHASIRIQAVIDQDVHVVIDFENIDPAIYDEVVQQGLFNVSIIPEAIREKFEQLNLTDARCNYDPAQEIFGSSTDSIHVEFYLTGSDILNFTINSETRTKTYRVRTDWRRFHINLTHETSLYFSRYFGLLVSRWEQINYTLNEKTHPTYYYNFTSSSQIDPSFYFILPEKATNVHAVKDTIIFEVPLSFEESFLDSPFLILTVLIVAVIIAIFYRRIRR